MFIVRFSTSGIAKPYELHLGNDSVYLINIAGFTCRSFNALSGHRGAQRVINSQGRQRVSQP